MQSPKHSDSERDFGRDSAGNAKALSNPTTLAGAAAASANAWPAFAGAAEHQKRARAVISSAKWHSGTPEQRFRAASGCGARPSSDFESKARPVRCFRVLPNGFLFFRAPPTQAEDLIYNTHIYIYININTVSIHTHIYIYIFYMYIYIYIYIYHISICKYEYIVYIYACIYVYIYIYIYSIIFFICTEAFNSWYKIIYIYIYIYMCDDTAPGIHTDETVVTVHNMHRDA